MKRPTIAIIGGGLAGLGCALALHRASLPFRLFEAAPALGGLARSETRDGFTFDLAGHWLHVRDRATRSLLAELFGADLLEFDRASWIYTQQRWIPYPFQSNLWALPADIRDDCLAGFVRARSAAARHGDEESAPPDFLEAVIRTWGDGIARHFVVPYNEKLWGLPLHELAPDWAGRFLPAPSPDQVVQGAIARTATAGYNARLFYPRDGGIGAVAERLGKRVNGSVSLDCPVAAVDLSRRDLHLADGRHVGFDRLVSTMPLPALIACCTGVPAEIAAAADGLRAVGVSCVNVAVRGPAPRGVPPCHWAYFPEPRFPFYRVGCGAAAVPTLAPPGCRSFSVEFSQHSANGEALERQALAGLQDCGLIQPADEVLQTFTRSIACAYVICDGTWKARRRLAQNWLRRHGVWSIGRYGGWQYGSMEDALLAGQQAAEQLMNEHAAAGTHG